MYRCDDCNTDFETPKLIKDSESGDFLACPHCGKSDYYEIIECPECGKTEYVEDMPFYCGMCKECFIEKYTDTLGYKYFVDLSVSEQKDALKSIYDVEGYINYITYRALTNDLDKHYFNRTNYRDFALFENLKEFCLSDLTAFAEWCEDNEVFKNG